MENDDQHTKNEKNEVNISGLVAVQLRVIYCAFLFEMKAKKMQRLITISGWLCIRLIMGFNYIINYIMRIICYLCTNLLSSRFFSFSWKKKRITVVGMHQFSHQPIVQLIV